MRRSQWTDEDWIVLQDMFQSGHTDKEIGLRLGYSVATIRVRRKERGYKRYKLPVETDELLRLIYQIDGFVILEPKVKEKLKNMIHAAVKIGR